MALINFHNIVHIETDQNFPWQNVLSESFGDVIRICGSETNADPIVRLRIVYDKSMSKDGLRWMYDDAYAAQGALMDIKYGVRLECPEKNLLVMHTDGNCLEWVSWASQLAFLAAGMTLVHAAAVEKDGQALVFCSWGGVGKTALTAGFIQDHGWNLLGDDFVLMSSDGACYSIPKPMVLYPYHKSIFPGIFSSGRGPTAPPCLNKILSKAVVGVKPILRRVPGLLQFARDHNPQSVRINPSEVFGIEKIARTAKAGTVLWLDRIEGISEPEFRPDDGKLASRVLGSTICQFDPRCVILSNIAMGMGIINRLYDAWTEALQSGLKNCDKHVLYLPADLPVTDVAQAVYGALSQREMVGV